MASSRSTTHHKNALRINTGGIRRRIKNMPYEHDSDDDSKEYIYVQVKDSITTTWCLGYVFLWFATLLAALYYLQHHMCRITEAGIMKVDCKSPDFIYHPVLMDHVITGMKTNRRVKRKTRQALILGEFDETASWKKYLYGMDIDLEHQEFINKNEDGLNIHISAIIYSNQYNTRIGEVGVPLTTLYYENCIDQMTIIDDTINHKSAELWEQEILFDDKLPSEQLKVSGLDEVTKNKYARWDIMDNMKSNSKQFVRTAAIGIWKGYEMGSRLAYVPKTEKKKTDDSDKNNIELLLFLDTFHQLPFNDEWIRNAMALFEQYPNLQVLGGFSGIIRDGKTFGDVNVQDMRTENMDNEAKVFVMSRESNYYSQMVNKRRYDESRVNIVELMDKYKEEYFDKYLKSFWVLAKEKAKKKGFIADDDEDDEEPVGLFSMNFLNDFDGAVFLNENDPDFDENKVQTGYEAIEHVVKERFLKHYEKEIEKRLPIPAKILKQIDMKRKECQKILRGSPTTKEKEECEVLMKPGGQTVIDYFFIPYEQKIRIWDKNKNEIKDTWIPFMFISSVRMGPIFIRRDWWFDKLLPHLSELESRMGKLEENLLDIEISLYTWSLGGYVGLYDAEGFRFDRDDFEIGLNRNKQTDYEWNRFVKNHHLAQYKDWNVWNVSHLIHLNEKEINDDSIKQKYKNLRLRTSIDDTSSNPQHPTALENSREILLTIQSFEQNDKQYNEKLIRLQKKGKVVNSNPLN